MFGQNGSFVLLAIALIVALIEAHPPKKVVGGSLANPGEIPYQVSLRYQGRHICSGAIVSSRHILTSARCVKKVHIFGSVFVVTGSVRANEGQTHQIKQIFYHANWNQYVSGAPNDIALIVLARGIVFTRFQNKINLPYAPAPSGAVAVVSGWGAVAPPYNYVRDLRKAHVYTISASQCRVILLGTSIIWTHQICTRGAIGVGICTGDEGGPLALNGQLIGIVSWGFLCGHGYPDVYTSVYHYLNWITYYIQTT